MAQIKANQPKLYNDVVQTTTTATSLGSFEEQDNTHGRQVKRTVNIFFVENEFIKSTWQNVKVYISVHRERTEHGKTKEENAYFMSNTLLEAEKFHFGIKEHWGIENKLHYVKDVVHNEDKNKINSGNGAITASVFSTIAINFHRKENHQSITHGQILFRANVNELFNKIRT